MQVERQWKLLRLIPDKLNRRSTDELWSALRSDVEYDEVSKRTVERDLVFLQTLFPLEQSTEGRTNYWYWRERAAMWLPGMTDDEALVFHMIERIMGDLLPEVSIERLSAYFAAASARLRDKRQGRRSWANKFRIVASGVPRIARKRFNPEPTRVLRRALLDDMTLLLSVYCDGLTSAKTIPTREIRANPLALIQLDSELLLVYTEHGSSSAQHLPLRDVATASIGNWEFDGPASFNIDKYIESGVLSARRDLPIEVGKSIQMSISLVRDEWMRWARSPLAISKSIKHDDDGRTRLVMPICFTSDLAHWLLGLGSNVEVHQPLELRNWIAARTREAADQYGGESARQKLESPR
jgi:predicted DNA-binding transcriptional regulator YafY